MAERQIHGKQFEAFCADCIDIDLSQDYTADDDATLLLDDGTEVAVSIKAIRNGGEVCLGSFNRIIHCDYPVLFIIGWHTRGNVRLVDIAYLPYGFRDLFGYCGSYANQVEAFVDGYMDYLLSDENFAEYANGFNDRGYDKIWSEHRQRFLTDYRSIFDDETIIIHPRPKRDHKHQRRLQCAIPYRRMDDFYNSPSVEVIARGVAVSDLSAMSQAITDAVAYNYRNR